MSRNWPRGSTAAWRRVRARVLAANLQANGGRCTLALPEVCTGRATAVHHVRGRGVTGDDPRYLAAVCQPCNNRVGDPTRHVELPKSITVSKW